MARYIDADKLQKAVVDLAPHPHDNWETVGVWHLIEQAPTLTLDDLRPKGRWVEGYPVTCSICGHSAETLYEDCNIYRAIRTPYCSYCGADMRGGGKDG